MKTEGVMPGAPSEDVTTTPGIFPVMSARTSVTYGLPVHNVSALEYECVDAFAVTAADSRKKLKRSFRIID